MGESLRVALEAEVVTLSSSYVLSGTPRGTRVDTSDPRTFVVRAVINFVNLTWRDVKEMCYCE